MSKVHSLEELKEVLDRVQAQLTSALSQLTCLQIHRDSLLRAGWTLQAIESDVQPTFNAIGVNYVDHNADVLNSTNGYLNWSVYENLFRARNDGNMSTLTVLGPPLSLAVAEDLGNTIPLTVFDVGDTVEMQRGKNASTSGTYEVTASDATTIDLEAISAIPQGSTENDIFWLRLVDR